MRTLHVIGLGTGGPDQLTLEAVRTLAALDAVFLLDKGSEKEELLALRRLVCARHARPDCRLVEVPDVVRDPAIADYETRVDAWHDARSRLLERAIREQLGEDGVGGLLVWGDPSLYDSTLRILERIAARGELPFAYRVVPGLSSVQLLAARHRIALNGVGGPVHITTGRRLMAGEARDLPDVVVMLDGEQAFLHVPDDGVDIFWGAYLGGDAELLARGPLREVKHAIAAQRAEARQRHGWIMDIYLLRRR